MKIKRLDVINLEWSSKPNRDRQVTTLVCNYLRYMGYSVSEYSCFDAIRKTTKYHPKLLFISGSIGTSIAFKMVKYAKSKNIKVLTLTSESQALSKKDFVKNDSFWGDNTDNFLYEDVNLVWSQKHYENAVKYWPEIKEKVKVGGGIGFDNYVLSPQKNKNKFLKKYKKEGFQKIVGFGCWAFDFINPKHINHSFCEKIFKKEDFSRFDEDREQSNQILINLVSNNPAILFLIKEHPGSDSHYYSATEGLEEFKNVLLLKNEAPIFDCISVSDFWLSYESTTAIEAWVMDKQTALINPTGVDFKGRTNVYKGQPNYRTFGVLQQAIDIFYRTKKLPNFDDEQYKQARQTIIKETIEWDDGLNHVRSGNAIIDLLNKNMEKVEVKNSPFWWLAIQNIKWIFSPYLRFLESFRVMYNSHRKKWNDEELKKFSDKKMKDQLAFYQKKNLTKEQLLKIKIS